MPSFIRDIKERGRSFRRNRSSTNLPNGRGAQSTASLNSMPPNVSTGSDGSVGSGVNGRNGDDSIPPVPTRPGNNTKRYSLYSNMTSPISPGQRTPPLRSPLAPEVLSISESSGVHNSVLLIHGEVGSPRKPVDGTLYVSLPHEGTSVTSWEVCDGYFKALIYLQPGPNPVRLEYVPLASINSNGQLDGVHVTIQSINCVPNSAKPPLHMAIIVAKDSPLTYDAVPERIRREGNGLDMAVRKFKMAGYLWQAFTAEHMVRNGFGRRCFRLEEEWQPGSLFRNDIETGQMRSEVKIHIIRSERTVAEIQDLNIAQQYGSATEKNKLMDYAIDALRSYFIPQQHQKRYFACMFLDSHWDPHVKTIRGHAALGMAGDDISLGIFGSHALQSYPSCLEEVQPAFTDCTPTDTNYVANDLNEAGSNWEAANIGIGAHLHEVGHCFGSPHQENGIMMRDYTRLNRSFNVREASSISRKTKGMRPCLGDSECGWHRLDLLRFRFHPCFRLQGDRVPLNHDDTIQLWTFEEGAVLATSNKGISFIEIYIQGEDFCKHHIECFSEPGRPRLQYMLNEKEIRAGLPKDTAKKRLKIVIHGAAAPERTIDDIRALGAKDMRFKLDKKRWGYRGAKLGFSQMDGSQPQELVLNSAVKQTVNLACIRVYHGLCVDGVEFMYDDNSRQLFGNRGGKPGGSDYVLDTRRGETLLGFYVRAGAWIDGIQIISSDPTGIKKSPIFGNPTGGSGHTLIPPPSYTIAGITGSCASWLDGFGLIITR